MGPSEGSPRDRAARPPADGDEEAFETELADAVDELLRRCCAEAQSRRLADDLADAQAGEQPGVTHGEPAPDVGTRAAEAAMAASLAEFEAAERLCAVVAHAQLGALRRMHGCAQALVAASRAQSWVGRTPLEAVELVTLEVVAATGLSTSDIDARLQLAEAPEGRLGAVRRALALGRTTLRRAVRLTQLTRHLDDEAADRVARAVLAPTRDGAGLSDRLFAQRLRRALLVVDPDRVASRRAARRRIGAWARIDDDGTGTLTVVNDAEAVVAAIERADAAARAARAAGDPRSLDRLRADFITGAAMFGWPGDDPSSAGRPARPAGTVSVVVPFSTLVGLDDEPCELPGHGWVGAEHAREIATVDGSVWQVLLADVDTGRAVALSTRRHRPTAEMVRFVRAVDGTCRGPGCEVPADRCDLDHDVPWPVGETHVGNLTCKHRAHHRVRTTGLWSAVRHTDGRVVWRTAAGRLYVTRPHDWLEGDGGPRSYVVDDGGPVSSCAADDLPLVERRDGRVTATRNRGDASRQDWTGGGVR
ncbi:HNH endonuclease signature motif containing protein [Terracoccus luteus]|uniref:HNH endonuclease n=1 Tax=Terracoccus luteus TaxID=53356 RepID=A0A839PS21_9MICO|nr:HNH endonuclease signature motif containing protein [Terracoccus luteus]MBB2986980.1 hypothetical protein [Terracoccus luteus]MCP2172631.1 hypothetical protein [Terracoccus luteus]